jgi:hypothetical protein
MDRFHKLEWIQRLELAQEFEDERCRRLARRLIYFEQPDLLDERAKWDARRNWSTTDRSR